MSLLKLAFSSAGGIVAACLLASTSPATAADCTPSAPGIISWWPGDGNASDIAGTNNGILGGGASAVATGLVGQAFSFDGTNNYVQIPDTASLRPTNLTVEAWVLFTSLDSAGTGPAQGSQYIIFKQNSRSSSFEGFCLNKTRISGLDHLAFQVTSSSGQNIEVDSVSIVTTGTWYHVAGVRGTNFVQLYVNGNLEGQSTITFQQDYGNYPLYFGTSGESAWDRKLEGLLDEATLYNRALTSDEIAAVYEAGAAGKCKSPNITVQPLSQSVLAGGSVSFTVAATGFGSLNYQWQFNGVNITGANATNLLLNNVLVANSGSYSVVVTNNLGSETSLAAVLNVLVPPGITSQPQSLTNIAGTLALFSVGASGSTPLSYQWQLNGANIPGATNSSLTLNSVQSTDAGMYSVSVANVAGAVTSSTATLIVWVPPSITSQPQSLTNVAGALASFGVVASGTAPLSYQWQLNGANISGATNTSLTLNSVQSTDAGNYQVIVTNFAGSATSAIATLTVLGQPIITSQPTSETNTAGTTATFTVSASGAGPLQFQWMKNGTKVLDSAGKISGSGSQDLTIVNALAADDGLYSVMVSNAAGTVASADALLVVIDPVIAAQPVSSTVTAGSTVSFTVGAAGTPPLSYQWQFDGANIPGANTASLTLKDVQLSDAGAYAAVVTNSSSSTVSLAAMLIVSSQAPVPDPHLDAALVSALGKCYFTKEDLLNLTHLEACNAGISNLSGLEFATNLTSLNLGGNFISDISPLQNLMKLKTLLLYNNQITDASILGGLTNLNYLEIRNNPLSHVELTMGGLTNLTELYLGGTSVSNLTFTANLQYLNFLNLDHDNVHDLSPLAMLPNLTGLGLAYNPVDNIAELGGLTNLTSLNLSGDLVSNLIFVPELTQLNFLSVCSNSFSDLSPLAGLSNLGGLNLGWNPSITNYAALSGLTSLTNLWLYGNSISNAPNLLPLGTLAYLNLDDNAITRLLPLAGLTSLKYLSLERNPITSYAALTSLTNLIQLSLKGDNSIENVSFVSYLNQLAVLNLNGNLIADLSPLGGLTNLVCLDAGWNPIASSPSFLSSLTALRCLNLQGDSLSDLSFLPPLVGLKVLDLSTNVITDLSQLSGLTNLVSLYLSQNRFSAIDALTNLTKLGYADLGLNLLNTDPVAAEAQVIQNLQNQCPSVDIDFLPQRMPPVVTSLANTVGGTWYIGANTNSTLSFTIVDNGPPGERFTVGASSSNENLIPSASLVPSQDAAGMWHLSIIPTTNSSNSGMITLWATNDVGLIANVAINTTAIIPQPVSLEDPNLDAAVRSQLGIPDGTLNTLELETLTYLNIVGGVTNLSGLELMPNLTTLYLNSVNVSDLTVLQRLPILNSLTIVNSPSVPFSELSGMTNLQSLFLNIDLLTDLRFLQGLTRLQSLSLDWNLITNIAPLSALTNLSWVSLQQNLISDISPIENLPAISFLGAQLNVLDLSTNSSASTGIQDLLDQGTLVLYVPQRSAPALSAPIDWTISAGTTATAPFSVIDNLPSDGAVTVTASSFDQTVIPNSNLVLVDNPNFPYLWTVYATPAPNLLQGSTTVRITATNQVGIGWLWDIHVTVVPPLTFDAGTLSSSVPNWLTCANSPWFGESLITHDGVSAAQSGPIGDSSDSWLETTVTGPGTISFWWKVSSETNSDWLRFYENDVLRPVQISGETAWNQEILRVPIGTQTLKWDYSKDFATSEGMDAGWLDDVSFTPGSWLEITGRPTNGQCALLLHPVTGRLFELQWSTNLMNWSSLSYLVATNNSLPFLDSSASQAARFYRLHEFPAGSIQLLPPAIVGNEVQLTLISPPGVRFLMQVSPDLVNWTSLGVITNTLGTVQYNDPFSPGSPARFYRAQPLP